MKKVLLFIFLLYSVIPGKAQDIRSFSDNTSWSYFLGFINDMPIGKNTDDRIGINKHTEFPVSFTNNAICQYYINGVSLKNSKIYDKLKVNVFHIDGGRLSNIMKIGPGCDEDVYAKDMPGLRMADGRIYVYEEEYISFLKNYDWNFPGCDSNYIPYKRTGDGEIVLYDFTMKVGDMFEHVDGYEDIYVTDVRDTCLTDGVSRRLLTLSNKLKLLEGVGCLNSKGMLLFYLNTVVSDKENEYQSDGLYLFAGLSAFGGEQTIYSLSDEDIVINGIHQAGVQHGGGRDADASVYDLSGRRVTGTPRAGVYIKGGRKIVVK